MYYIACLSQPGTRYKEFDRKMRECATRGKPVVPPWHISCEITVTKISNFAKDVDSCRLTELLFFAACALVQLLSLLWQILGCETMVGVLNLWVLQIVIVAYLESSQTSTMELKAVNYCVLNTLLVKYKFYHSEQCALTHITFCAN